jgi:hypothetical protein
MMMMMMNNDDTGLYIPSSSLLLLPSFLPHPSLSICRCVVIIIIMSRRVASYPTTRRDDTSGSEYAVSVAPESADATAGMSATFSTSNRSS